MVHKQEKFGGLLEKDYLNDKISKELERLSGEKIYPARFWKMKLVDMRNLYNVLRKIKR
jgi:hypothetical protein